MPVAAVGAFVCTEGDALGLSEGLSEGNVLGDDDGDVEGKKVGVVVGLSLGDEDGLNVGNPVGNALGDADGLTEGASVFAQQFRKLPCAVGQHSSPCWKPASTHAACALQSPAVVGLREGEADGLLLGARVTGD